MSSGSTNNHVNLAGLVFIVFLTLKLLGKLSWSWLWVTSPLWIPLLVAIVILIIAVVLKLIIRG